MGNEIRDIQLKRRNQLIKIYSKRLEEIKKAIFAAAQSGDDTRTLTLQKNKVERILKELKKEFEAFANETIKETYTLSQEEQKKQLRGLELALIGLLSVQFPKNKILIKDNQELLTSQLNRITNGISLKVNNYFRTDFSDNKQIVKALTALIPKDTGVKPLNNLAQLRLISSEVDPTRWKTLLNTLETNLKNADIFTIPYYNKNKEVVRRVKASTYAEMLARTLTAKIYRDAAETGIKETFREYGDLVEILGRTKVDCSECKPFEGQILSLEGKTKGYTTIAEAKEKGLFHPNCVHSFAVTDNIISIYNKEYPLIEHFSKANILARKAQQAVYQKGIKKGELQKKAVEYLNNKIPKQGKFGYVVLGELNSKAKGLLKAKNNNIRFSYESLAKNIIKHSDLTLEDYLKIDKILKDPTSIEQDNNNPKYNIVYYKQDKKIYRLVIKTTKNREENYITSFRFADKWK